MEPTHISDTLVRVGVSATELANRADIPRPTVYAHIKGLRSIGQAHARAYAAALNVDLEDVLGPPATMERASK